jgi:hypothetical protein
MRERNRFARVRRLRAWLEVFVVVAGLVAAVFVVIVLDPVGNVVSTPPLPDLHVFPTCRTGCAG